jgi:hypothetical protein
LVSVFEFYYPYVVADTNVDFMVDPEEMMGWLIDNEYDICAPFETVINELVNELNKEFESEEDFASIFQEN